MKLLHMSYGEQVLSNVEGMRKGDATTLDAFDVMWPEFLIWAWRVVCYIEDMN